MRHLREIFGAKRLSNQTQFISLLLTKCRFCLWTRHAVKHGRTHRSPKDMYREVCIAEVIRAILNFASLPSNGRSGNNPRSAWIILNCCQQTLALIDLLRTNLCLRQVAVKPATWTSDCCEIYKSPRVQVADFSATWQGQSSPTTT